MDSLRFDGRVALITGAGRGLGRSYALLLAARGASVVVNDLGGSMAGEGEGCAAAESVVAEIIAAGGQAIANTDSVATEEGCRRMVEQTVNTFGKVDILIHNAGNVRYGSLDTLSDEDFRAVTDVHFLGGFRVVRQAFPHMRDARYGRVVLTSSISGLYGCADTVNYGMSKAGLIGLNNVVAIEGEEHGIQSNVILPGAVTRMADGLDISQYPPMEPERVAPVVGWLAHESCDVSGEHFVSMAGRVARAMVCETPGLYRPDWTIESVAEASSVFRSTETLWTLPVLPSGFADHMTRSFEMAVSGGENED